MEFPFYDEPNIVTIICWHIVENWTPILSVSHDEDNPIDILNDMGCGYYAERKTQDYDWIIKNW